MLVELQYDLTRKQRLLPHLRVWGIAQLLVIIGLVVSVIAFARGSWSTGLPVGLVTAFIGRGYIIGIFNALFVSSQHMDIQIEDSGLGFMAGDERMYIFLDGLTGIHDFESRVWTVQHWNGTIVNIPKEILPDEALDFLRNWVILANEIRDGLGIQSPHPTKPTKA